MSIFLAMNGGRHSIHLRAVTVCHFLLCWLFSLLNVLSNDLVTPKGLKSRAEMPVKRCRRIISECPCTACPMDLQVHARKMQGAGGLLR